MLDVNVLVHSKGVLGGVRCRGSVQASRGLPRQTGKITVALKKEKRQTRTVATKLEEHDEISVYAVVVGDQLKLLRNVLICFPAES